MEVDKIPARYLNFSKGKSTRPCVKRRSKDCAYFFIISCMFRAENSIASYNRKQIINCNNGF